MADEIVDDLPGTEPVVESGDELDNIIAGAIEKSEAPADETSEQKAERVRDEQGRFAEKPAEASKEPVLADAADPDKVADPAPQPVEPPARWSEADKAKFAALPREAQEIVAERNKAMEADYTRKTQEVAEFRRHAEPLVQAVQPYQQYLSAISKQTGMQPAALISGILAAEHSLRTGTVEQKVQALAQIAGDYGVDLAALARGEVAAPDPTIIQLRQQNSQLTNRFESLEQQLLRDQQQKLSLEIDAFANAKDEAGKPKYPHFSRVRGQMAQMFGTDGVQTLQDAYDRAVAPINEAVALELSTRQQAAEASRQQALAKAKQAAPVRSTGTQPRGSTTGQDLDAILSAAIAKSGIN